MTRKSPMPAFAEKIVGETNEAFLERTEVAKADEPKERRVRFYRCRCSRVARLPRPDKVDDDEVPVVICNHCYFVFDRHTLDTFLDVPSAHPWA